MSGSVGEWDELPRSGEGRETFGPSFRCVGRAPDPQGDARPAPKQSARHGGSHRAERLLSQPCARRAACAAARRATGTRKGEQET